jgi:hypothetical protein
MFKTRKLGKQLIGRLLADPYQKVSDKRILIIELDRI